MLTVNKLLPRGQGLSQVLLKRAPSVQLDWDVRQKSRFDAIDTEGRQLGVFLPRGTVVRGGDVLVAEDGTLVRVQAAPQAVMVVTPCAAHGSPFDLVRAAYHLGNRHVSLELQADRLQFEPDTVLADMLRKMHLDVVETQAPFEPESGAYAASTQGHGHGHAHEPAHAHGESHAPAHDHNAHSSAPVTGKPVPISVRAAPAPHVHGPGCNHGHGHGHGDDHNH
ncbi:MAG: urease accessory protein UreE [Pseudomonadota bacterium]